MRIARVNGAPRVTPLYEDGVRGPIVKKRLEEFDDLITSKTTSMLPPHRNQGVILELTDQIYA